MIADPPGTSDSVPHAWVARLSGSGADRDAAVAELHALLYRAARFEVGRRRSQFPHLGGTELDDLAVQSANDALMSILRRLGDFRGDSRFTTWACKFAIVEAGVKVRRAAWREREVPLPEASWPVVTDGAPTPHQFAEARDLRLALQEVINQQLTAWQREVLVTLTLNNVPIDVLAERLNTTRGALYKTLHDARRKIRAALDSRGLSTEGSVR
ncbi:MAG TPA: sigma-70 family RNA polymerase sigma factor [Streptosporangiaceae bacterium]|nr:sigma-70 family RNA polymerase sigma factor [Streptosporangiaceae bacterium]